MATLQEKPVPFVDLTIPSDGLRQEIDFAVQRVFAGASFILGEVVNEFEQEFASYCGVKFCVTVNSGTAALHLGLLALGIGPGDEVITAANSFIATAEAISFCGASPRLVDVDPDTANIDINKIEEAINEKTKAIVPVHLYGQPADLTKIRLIAEKQGLKVLEDACQAHGAKFAGVRAGSLGDAACFSFYPAKNLGAAGDGGAFVTNNEELAEKVRLLRNHGSEEKYHHKIIGHNFRLDSMQAAVLNAKLPYLDEWNRKRRRLAANYSEQLKSLEGIVPISILPEAESVFHLYVVRVTDRKKVEVILKQSNIAYGIHYPVPIHLQPAYNFLQQEKGSFPNAENLSDSILSLPMYPGLTEEDQSRVVNALKRSSIPSI